MERVSEGRKEREMVFLGRRKEEKGGRGRGRGEGKREAKEGDFICAAFSRARARCVQTSSSSPSSLSGEPNSAASSLLSVDKAPMSQCIKGSSYYLEA